MTQTAASSLFKGNTTTDSEIGSPSGFDDALLGQLGGGVSSVSVRITLFDGDNQAGNFDFNSNFLTVNGLDFGNFSEQEATRTNSTNGVISTSLGFGNNTLDTSASL